MWWDTGAWAAASWVQPDVGAQPGTTVGFALAPPAGGWFLDGVAGPPSHPVSPIFDLFLMENPADGGHREAQEQVPIGDEGKAFFGSLFLLSAVSSGTTGTRAWSQPGIALFPPKHLFLIWDF